MTKNILAIEGLQCPKCKRSQNFYATVEVNNLAGTLDAIAVCRGEECEEESVISLVIRDLFVSSGQLEESQTFPEKE